MLCTVLPYAPMQALMHVDVASNNLNTLSEYVNNTP